MIRSRPKDDKKCLFRSLPTTAMTRPPLSRAHWAARWPRPPAAAVISTVSPFLRLAASLRPIAAVRPDVPRRASREGASEGVKRGLGTAVMWSLEVSTCRFGKFSLVFSLVEV